MRGPDAPIREEGFSQLVESDRKELKVTHPMPRRKAVNCFRKSRLLAGADRAAAMATLNPTEKKSVQKFFRTQMT
jgi:hypothetical protein